MRRFRVLPPVKHELLLVLFEWWNKFMMYLAKRYANKQAIKQNKAMYGSQMFGSIIVYSSREKRNINKGMAKGNRMNPAQVLMWSLFVVTPQGARKKNT